MRNTTPPKPGFSALADLTGLPSSPAWSPDAHGTHRWTRAQGTVALRSSSVCNGKPGRNSRPQLGLPCFETALRAGLGARAVRLLALLGGPAPAEGAPSRGRGWMEPGITTTLGLTTVGLKFHQLGSVTLLGQTFELRSSVPPMSELSEATFPADWFANADARTQNPRTPRTAHPRRPHPRRRRRVSTRPRCPAQSVCSGPPARQRSSTSRPDSDHNTRANARFCDNLAKL